MSDHGAPAEPGKDRAWLSLVVIAAALVIAAMVWRQGSAAPTPSKPIGGQTQDLLVLKDGTEVRGTVLIRGAGVVVLDSNGFEQAYPWSQVDKDRSFGAQPISFEPSASEPKRSPARSRIDDGGTIILKSGEVYVGRIVASGATVTVRWPYKSNKVRGEVSFPRTDVRWFEFGVEGPTRAYWRKFPNEAVIGHTNPLRRNDPLIVEAELAQNEGKWAEATRRWADIYRVKGFKEIHFLNLDTCARQWVKQAGDINASEAAARRLGDDLLKGLSDRAGVRKLLGEVYLELARIGVTHGRRKSAREFARRLKGLGAKYARQGEQVLKRLRGE